MRGMTVARIAALAAAGLAIALFAGVERPGGARSAAGEGSKVTVSGSGTVTTVPDRASFGFAVITKARTASAALAANGAGIAKVIAAIKAAGVASADVHTQSVSLSPRSSQDGTEILDYTASNSVAATIRDLGKAGAVVDAAVAAGADQVDGPNLTASDQKTFYRQALAAAVDDARAKAQTIAKAADLTLGRVLGVTEGSGGGPIAFASKAAGADSTPIEPGTQEISATVTVTFAAS